MSQTFSTTRGSTGADGRNEPAPGNVRVDTSAAPDSGTLRDLLAMCWRHRIVFATVSGAIALGFFVNSLRVVPMYESRATLEVFLGGKRIEFDEDKEYPGRIENGVLNTQSAKFMSSPVLTRALDISDLGDGPEYRGNGNPLGVLRSRLKVNTSRDSWAFDVVLRDEDGERAQRGLDAILNAYFSLLDQRTADHVGSSISFLTQQVEQARGRLDEARRDEQEFREARSVGSSDPDDNEHTKRLTALSAERAGLDRDLSIRDAQLAQLTQANSAAEEQERLRKLLDIEIIGRDPLVSSQQQELFRRQAEAQELTQKYQPKHPRMKEKQLEIEAKRKQLVEAVEQVRSGVVAAYAELRLQSADLDRRIAKEKESLSRYRDDLVRLQSLSQETRNREHLLEELSRRKAEQEVIAKMDAKQVALVNPPEAAIGPVNVNRGRSVAMAMFLGVVGGLLAALGFEKMDPRVRGAAAVRTLTGLPLLGRIPRLKAHGSDHALDELTAAFAMECYRALRSTIRLTGRVQRCRRLCVLSPSPGDGKSTVAFHLATALADGGSRVLLIDADMRNPSQDRFIGVATESGLSSLLSGESRPEPQPGPRPNLWYLGVGARPDTPADLLCSPELAKLLDDAASSFDFLVIDTPPVNFVADALIIGERCDELVLVVRDQVTLSGAVEDTLARLEPLRDKLSGFVLNAAREKSAAGTYYIFKDQ